ncbi:MAG: hypothetical protein ABR529_09140 [Actinomycetota bacterium]
MNQAREKARSKKRSWRDIFPVHPAANVFPMMSDEELEDDLGRDIKENGWLMGEWAMILDPDSDEAELLGITSEKSIAMESQFDHYKLMLRREKDE